RHHHRLSAHAHFFDIARRALYFQTDTTGTIDEIPLFDDKLVDAVRRIDASRIVVNEITAQRSRRTAGRLIFADIFSDKEPRVRARLADFDRFAREGVTSRRT